MKNLNRLSGLQVVFNNSGKNPYNHDIKKCLRALALKQQSTVCAAVMFVAGFLCEVLVGFSWFFDGLSVQKLVSMFIGGMMVIIALKIFRLEFGENLIYVATQWQRVNSNLKRLGVNLLGKESGHQVASVFESRLVKVVSEKIAAEKEGTPRKEKELDKLFSLTKDLAEYLRLDVSSREDFFAGKGKVEFSPSYDS